MCVSPAESEVLTDALKLQIDNRRQNHHLAILRASRTQNILSFYEPHLRNAKFLRGINEPHLGREKPVSGIIKPLLGITKPTEELNMLHLEKEFCRIYFTAKVIIPIPGWTCAKAVAILCRRGNPRASSLRGNYYLRIVLDRSFHTTARFEVGASIAGVPRFGEISEHSPGKSQKRRRDREPSRIAVKKDHEFYRLTINYGKTLKSTCLMITAGYCLSRMKLMRSGDVKFNPGPEPNVDSQARSSDCC